MLNILIVSGGTGSTNLQSGLKQIGGEYIKITNLINLYDDGKSTGICRRVFDCLGPSDLRKNQYTQWLNKHQNTNHFDERIVELFIKRYDILTEKIAIEFINRSYFPKKYLEFFQDAILEFFSIAEKRNIKNFDDFNLANIIYSYGFYSIGVNETIKFMAEFLEIEDNVIVNNTENNYIYGITKNGNKLDESEIVNYKNDNDEIVRIEFSNKRPTLHKNVIDAIYNADIIVLSAGTQWSSLIPTYESNGFYHTFNETKAKKYLVMNNEQDGDMYGCTSVDIIDLVSRYFNFKDITVLFNDDAQIPMKKITPEICKICNVIKRKMGNDIKGRHNGYKLAMNILQSYYNLSDITQYRIMSDFDDTLFSRNSDLECTSFNNIKIFNEISKHIPCYIVSGNSYDRILKKINKAFGPLLENFNIRIFADGGLIDKRNKVFDRKYMLYRYDINISRLLHYLWKNNIIDEYNYEERGTDVADEYLSCLSITGLEQKYRNILCLLLNEKFSGQFKICKTGLGTIDIFNLLHDKCNIFNILGKSEFKTYYFGDEIENGNDYNIALNSDKYQIIKDVREMEIILRIILWTIENEEF